MSTNDMKSGNEEDQKITVFLADGHTLFRQGLRQALSEEQDITIVGETDDGDMVCSLAETLFPDVVILDSELSSQNDLALARELRLRIPKVAVIVLTPYDDEEQVFQAIKAGAAACLGRKINSDALVSTVRYVSQGKYPINESLLTVPGIASRVLHEFQSLSLILKKEVEPLVAPLSNREIEILDYIARGNSNKQIARVFGISEQTVKNHVISMLRKLAARDRTQAVVIALENGWIRRGQQNGRKSANLRMHALPIKPTRSRRKPA